MARTCRTPGLTQTELAKCLELERASVGHVIDQLEAADYVERRAMEGNRRVWTLHLQPKAMQILPSLREEAEAIYRRLFAGVSVAEIATLKRLLGTMSANLEP
jgi:MarR family transcriptional regulator, transcriptional regulator for hemolysin